MKKLAIIGASHFQNPLIIRAKQLGLQTHVFAWAAGDAGESTADFFYPISITEKDAILDKCREIGIDGIATIGSDLANITVAYVANALGLTWNDVECVARSTDKGLMRHTFEENGDPSPASYKVRQLSDLDGVDIAYPAIVKPVDRSGSRGVHKVAGRHDLASAIENAVELSFAGCALVEEFVDGREFSVEYCSWEGRHRFLALTEKFTSGAPHFIEKGHLEPARVSEAELSSIQEVVAHALNSLGVRYGASHSEVKITPDGAIKIMEIGSRMGGDCIGSDLVKLSTGYDYVEAVIQIALGNEPSPMAAGAPAHAAIRFVFDEADATALADMKAHNPDVLIYESPIEKFDHSIVDSSTRFGYYIFASSCFDDIKPYLPDMNPAD